MNKSNLLEATEGSSESLNSGKKHFCNQCTFTSNFKSNLNSHTKSIHEDHRYFCNDCDYQGKQKRHLKRHKMFIHEVVFFLLYLM